MAAPAFIPGVDWSDHWSFWQENYPALMVTDTAPYRYPHYHTLRDTPDKVDYERLARVVTGLHGMLRGGAGKGDDSCPAGQKLYEAVAQQQDLLAEFEKIADELNLSVKTVSSYRTRILEKMAMKSNADIMYYAIKNGLIQ